MLQWHQTKGGGWQGSRARCAGSSEPSRASSPQGQVGWEFPRAWSSNTWGARPLELLGSAERASWQEPGLPFPSFLKLPSAMGLLFSMQGFHQPRSGRGHWGRAMQDPKSRWLLGSTCTTQSVAPRQAGACVAPWPPLLTAELLATERESLLCRDHHCACLGLASRTPRTSRDLLLLFTWGCRILFLFCLVSGSDHMCYMFYITRVFRKAICSGPDSLMGTRVVGCPLVT